VGLEAWLTLAVIVIVVAVLAREMVQPATAVLGGVIVLLLLGVITPAQAFSGFSSEAPIVIAALLVLGRAIELSGLLQPIVGAIFGTVRSMRALTARLVLPVVGISAFMNNTTIVAMGAPAVIQMSRQRQLSASRFLIPLSYGALLGGVITTIGTSANLTISGLLVKQGLPPLTLFEITPVGLPAALSGALILILLAPRLLPDRADTRPEFVAGGRDFTVSMRVVDGGALDGAPVEQAGLRSLRGVFLVEIGRSEGQIAPVPPTETLRGGDLLTFVGRVDDIVDLQRMRGLISAEARQLDRLGAGTHVFYEVVVGTSDLIGRTLKEVGFRGRYSAAVLAIHRQGRSLEAKLGEVRLHMGDTLLVLADREFRDRWRDSRDFLVISPLGGIPPTARTKAPLVAAIGLAFIVVTGTGLMPLLNGALLTAVALVATRAIDLGQARRAIDLNLIVLIAASFGLGAAVQSSGLAQVIADTLLAIFSPLGPQGMLAGILLATIALTEVITHNAAAVLLFPVAVATATSLGLQPLPFVLAVLFGASLSFLTPVGYQTNVMVYGLGNYRFLDFPRVGLPLIAVVATVILVLLPVFFPFQPL
jgi:di/tricarboxylate transporter